MVLLICGIVKRVTMYRCRRKYSTDCLVKHQNRYHISDTRHSVWHQDQVKDGVRDIPSFRVGKRI